MSGSDQLNACRRSIYAEHLMFCPDCKRWYRASCAGVEGSVNNVDWRCSECIHSTSARSFDVVPKGAVSDVHRMTPVDTTVVNQPAVSPLRTEATTTAATVQCGITPAEAEETLRHKLQWLQRQADLMKQQMEEQLRFKYEWRRAEVRKIAARAEQAILAGVQDEASNGVREETATVRIGKVDEWVKEMVSEMKAASIAQPSALYEASMTFRPELNYNSTTMSTVDANLGILDRNSSQILNGAFSGSVTPWLASPLIAAASPQSQKVSYNVSNPYTSSRSGGMNSMVPGTLTPSNIAPTPTVPLNSVGATMIPPYDGSMRFIFAVNAFDTAANMSPALFPCFGSTPAEDVKGAPYTSESYFPYVVHPSTISVDAESSPKPFLEQQSGICNFSLQPPVTQKSDHLIKGTVSNVNVNTDYRDGSGNAAAGSHSVCGGTATVCNGPKQIQVVEQICSKMHLASESCNGDQWRKDGPVPAVIYTTGNAVNHAMNGCTPVMKWETNQRQETIEGRHRNGMYQDQPGGYACTAQTTCGIDAYALQRDQQLHSNRRLQEIDDTAVAEEMCGEKCSKSMNACCTVERSIPPKDYAGDSVKNAAELEIPMEKCIDNDSISITTKCSKRIERSGRLYQNQDNSNGKQIVTSFTNDRMYETISEEPIAAYPDEMRYLLEFAGRDLPKSFTRDKTVKVGNVSPYRVSLRIRFYAFPDALRWFGDLSVINLKGWMYWFKARQKYETHRINYYQKPIETLIMILDQLLGQCVDETRKEQSENIRTNGKCKAGRTRGLRRPPDGDVLALFEMSQGQIKSDLLVKLYHSTIRNGIIVLENWRSLGSLEIGGMREDNQTRMLTTNVPGFATADFGAMALQIFTSWCKAMLNNVLSTWIMLNGTMKARLSARMTNAVCGRAHNTQVSEWREAAMISIWIQLKDQRGWLATTSIANIKSVTKSYRKKCKRIPCVVKWMHCHHIANYRYMVCKKAPKRDYLVHERLNKKEGRTLGIVVADGELYWGYVWMSAVQEFVSDSNAKTGKSEPTEPARYGLGHVENSGITAKPHIVDSCVAEPDLRTTWTLKRRTCGVWGLGGETSFVNVQIRRKQAILCECPQEDLFINSSGEKWITWILTVGVLLCRRHYGCVIVCIQHKDREFTWLEATFGYVFKWCIIHSQASKYQARGGIHEGTANPTLTSG